MTATRLCLLLALTACERDSPTTAPPDAGDSLSACLEACAHELEGCWPNGYHDEQAKACLVEHTVCENGCRAEVSRFR